MHDYRTNREQFGQRNQAVPTSVYTPFTLNVENGPGGSLAQSGADHGNGVQHLSGGLQRS